MHYIKKKLQEAEQNIIKDLSHEISPIFKEKDSFFFLTYVYDNFYKKIADEKDFEDDIKFAEFVRDFLIEMQHDLIKEDLETSKLLKIKATLNEYPNIYRIYTIPTVFFISNIVFATLSSFGAVGGEDYSIIHKEYIYFPTQVYENIDISEKTINADEMELASLEINKNDIFQLEYGCYKIDLQIIDITDNFDKKTEPSLIEVEGINIFDNDEEYIFDLLMKKDYNLLKELIEDEDYYNYIIETFTSDKYKEYLFNEFVDSYDMINETYNRYYHEYIEKKELISKLDQFPHIIKYKRIKQISEEIIQELSKYYLENIPLYEIALDQYYKENKIKQPFIKNDSTDIVEFFDYCLNIILPIGPKYISPSEYFYKNNLYTGEKKKVLESLMSYSYGLYEIYINEYTNGIIIFKNVITNQKLKIIDIDLSQTMKEKKLDLYFAIKSIKYEDISFIINFISLDKNNDVIQYIKQLKKNKQSPLVFYENINRIKKNQ